MRSCEREKSDGGGKKRARCFLGAVLASTCCCVVSFLNGWPRAAAIDI